MAFERSRLLIEKFEFSVYESLRGGKKISNWWFFGRGLKTLWSVNEFEIFVFGSGG